MPGPSTQTTTSSTAPSNPDVNPTLSKLLKGVQGAYDANPQGYFFNQSMYPGQGQATQGALSSLLSSSQQPTGFGQAQDYTNNLIGSGGLNNGMQSDIDLSRSMSRSATDPSLTEQTLMGVARGDHLNNMDPAYQAVIDRTANQTAADINAAMGSNGAYGSNNHVDALGSAIGDIRNRAAVENRQFEIGRQQQALGAIEGQRQTGFGNAMGAASQAFGMGQQGIGNAMGAAGSLGSLYQQSLLPGQTALTVGQMQDADAQATRQGQADLFLREKGAPTDQLAKLSSILAGNAGVGGTTSSQTTPVTPWWQSAIGLGIGLL